MPLSQDAFIQSKCAMFVQSGCLMRDAGMKVGIEYRAILYGRAVPGMPPIFPQGTGKQLYLDRLRRWHGRTVTAHELSETRTSRGEWYWGMTDKQEPGSLVMSTTGGESPNYSVSGDVTNNGKYYSGRGAVAYSGYPGTKRADYARIYDDVENEDLGFWYHHIIDLTETRELEVDWKLEVNRMRSKLYSSDFDTLWNAADHPNPLYKMNRRILHDQIGWQGSLTNMSAPFATATGAMSTEDYYGASGIQNRTTLSWGWGRTPYVADGINAPNAGQSIGGSRVQWRSILPVDWCVVEFLSDGSGASRPCWVLGQGRASAGQILEVPAAKLGGDGILSYGSGQEALLCTSSVYVGWGHTPASLIALLAGAGGPRIEVTPPTATPSIDSNSTSIDSNNSTIP